MKAPVSRVFIPKPLNPELGDNVVSIKKSFVSAGFKISESIKETDIAVIVGGDGSLLNSLARYDYPATPFIGISSGTLGFLQEIEADKVDRLISLLKTGSYEVASLPLLAFDSGETKGVAFNEVVIERASAQTAHLSIAVNGVIFDKFIGDGLIISTPQGSSAYALAAGGAFLSDGLQAMQLVPINPHNTVAYRSLHAPLVVPLDAKIEIANLSPKHRPMRILADGVEFEPGKTKTVSIGLSKKRASLLRTSEYDYYEMLARKFVK